MSEETRHNIPAIRELLRAGFNVEELRSLFSFAKCHELRPIADEFTPEDGKPAMIRKAVKYCQSRFLLNELLAEIEDANPRAYAQFEEQLGSSGAAVGDRQKDVSQKGIQIGEFSAPGCSVRNVVILFSLTLLAAAFLSGASLILPAAPTSTTVPLTTVTVTSRPPTGTPVPQFMWSGVPAGTFSNCGLTAFIGLTLDRSGGVVGDTVIHYWSDGWGGAWAVSEWVVDEGYPGEGDETNWDGIISNRAVAGSWYACVVPQKGSWDCISNRMVFTSVATPCKPDSGGVQVFRIVFQKN